MPILGSLLYALARIMYRFSLAMFGQAWAVRMTAITILAGLYVACAITFSVMIVPWMAALAATQFGMLLGLLFPPAAGTVLASLGLFWTCVLAKRYSARLIKLAIGGSSGSTSLVA
jgi:hypothetical protein